MADRETDATAGGTAPLDLEHARLDPASVFATPAALLADPRLDREQKIDLLQRWQYDAREMSVAEEEGMGNGEPSLVGEISRALHSLTDGYDAEHSSPTKQGGR
jgi:hypothetical protein